MAKRKLSNVMEVSSEESDGETTKLNVPAPKKPKTPFIPPRISAAPSQPLQVPQNVASSALRPKTLATTHSKLPALGAASLGLRLPTPHPTPPVAGNASAPEDETSDSDVLQTPSAGVSSKVAARAGMGPGPASQRPHQLAIGSQAPATRPNLALEKAFNQLANTLEANQKLNEERHQENEKWHRQYEEQNERNQKMLEQILGAVTQKQEASPIDPVGRAETPSAPTVTAGGGQFVPGNPQVTCELAEMVESVVRSTATRRKDKQARIAEEKANQRPSTSGDCNTINGHTRTAFFRMLGEIESAADIPPPFFDKAGNAIIFPIESTNCETGYRQPYPDWTSQLDKQIEWAPTYLQHFKGTIKPGNSPSSVLLRSLSDRTIVEYLHDGIFSTCRAKWQELSKGPEYIKQVQLETRRQKQQERLANLGESYRSDKDLAALQGPEYDWLFHAGAMSYQVTDVKGVTQSMNPPWRASRANNFYTCVGNAERQRTGTPCGPKPKRAPDTGLPILRRGTGSRTKTVKIAYSGLKQSWINSNQAVVDGSPHLIDQNVVDAPDISAFLERYLHLEPDTSHNNGATDDEIGQELSTGAPSGQVVDTNTDGEDGNDGIDEEQEQSVHGEEVGNDRKVFDGEVPLSSFSESARDRMARSRPRQKFPTPDGQSKVDPPCSTENSNPDPPFDHQLSHVDEAPASKSNVEGIGADGDDEDDGPPPTGYPAQISAELLASGYRPEQEMPPPLSLARQAAEATMSRVAAEALHQAKPSKAKPKAVKAAKTTAGSSTAANSGEPRPGPGHVPGGLTGQPEEPVKRKPGRPKGSKNKPKSADT